MSFGSFFRGIVAQVNPFDNGRTYGSYNPPQKKRIDQPVQPTIAVQPTNLTNNIPTTHSPVSFGTLHINNAVSVPQPNQTPHYGFWQKAGDMLGGVATGVAEVPLGVARAATGAAEGLDQLPALAVKGANAASNKIGAAIASSRGEIIPTPAGHWAVTRDVSNWTNNVNQKTLDPANRGLDTAAKFVGTHGLGDRTINTNAGNTGYKAVQLGANAIAALTGVGELSAAAGASKLAQGSKAGTILTKIGKQLAPAENTAGVISRTASPIYKAAHYSINAPIRGAKQLISRLTPSETVGNAANAVQIPVSGGDTKSLPVPTRVVTGNTITDITPQLPGETPPLSTTTPATSPNLIKEVGGDAQTAQQAAQKATEEANKKAMDRFKSQLPGKPDKRIEGIGNSVSSKDVADAKAVIDDKLATGKISEADHADLTQQLQDIKPTDTTPPANSKKINVKQVDTIPVQQVNDVPVDTPQTPGTVRVTKTTDPVKAQTEAVAAQTPASVPKNRPNQTLSIQERTKFSDKAQQVGDVTDTVISRADSGDIPGARTAADRLYEDPEYGANTARGQALLERGQKLKAYIDSKTGLSAEVSPARQELISSLKEANKQSVRDARALSVARGERAAKAKSMSQDLEGEAATIARKQGMKGELGHRGKYVGVGGDKAEELFNSLRIEAQRNPELSNRIYTLDNVEEALSRAIRGKDLRGADVGAPTKGQIELLRKYFGEDIGDAVEEAVNISKTTREKLLEGAGQVIGAPRSIMASFDLSATLRQGGVLSSRFPKEAAKAAKEQLRYFASSKSFKEGMQEITNRPSYDKMISSGLDVTGTHGLDKAEEQFISTLAEKIPGLGRGVAASDRAYTGFLTKLRADVFDKITNTYAERGIELSDKEMSDLARFINTASGRGDLGRLEDHAKTLSTTLFSPRLWKSRLDMLNPVYYAKLSGPARKYALQSAASFASIAASVLGLAALAGAKVETDLRSSDFGKIKVGNSRYDILGGFQQNLVFAWREITGEKKSTTTGETTKFARGIPDLIKGRSDKEAGVQTGPYTPNRVSIASDLVGNKATPVLGAAGRILSGKDRGGNPVNPLEELARMVVPLGLSGAVDAANDVGSATSPKDFLKGALINSPDVVGISSQTYGSVPTKDKNYDKYAAATDRANQLRDAGALTDSTQIKDALDNGDYNLAIKSYQYQKAQAEANPKSTKKEIARIDNSIKEVQYLQQGVPKTDDGILAHAESGDYDKAIAGLNWKIERSQADGELSNKTKSGIEVDITRFKVAKDNSLPYSDLQLYESTSQTDWASMGRQYMSNGDYNDNYDPETYQKLAQLDDLFTKAGGSYAKGDPTKNKYNPKGAGTGYGEKGPKMETSFGTLSSSGNPFAPKAREYQTASLAGTSNIPVINVVRPNIVHRIGRGS